MVARVTLAEVDAVRMRIDEAVEVLPRLGAPRAARAATGYEGFYVLRRREGKALVLEVLGDEEAADAGIAGSGFYAEQVAQVRHLLRLDARTRDVRRRRRARPPSHRGGRRRHDQALRHPGGDARGRPRRTARCGAR